MDINIKREIEQYNGLRRLIAKDKELPAHLLKYSHKFKDGIIAIKGISKDINNLRDHLLKIDNSDNMRVNMIRGKNAIIFKSGELVVKYPITMYKQIIRNVLPKYKNMNINAALFALYLRYNILGLMDGNSGAIPPKYYNEIKRQYPDTIELFASYFNKTMTRYCCLFGDIEYIFGGMDNLYNYKWSELGGTYVANPPFIVEELNKFAKLLKKIPAKCKILIIYPTFDINHRKLLNEICDNRLVTDYNNDCNTTSIIKMRRCNYAGLYCKGNFAYFDYIQNKYIQYASTTLMCINWDIYTLFTDADIVLKKKGG